MLGKKRQLRDNSFPMNTKLTIVYACLQTCNMQYFTYCPCVLVQKNLWSLGCLT